MKIAAISGSLRAGSSNTAVLRAAARLAPAGVEVILFEGIAGLPFFNPDLDGDDVPAPVGAMRKLVGGVGVRWAESGAGQRPSSGNNQSVDRPITKPNGPEIFLPPPAQAKRLPVLGRQI